MSYKRKLTEQEIVQNRVYAQFIVMLFVIMVGLVNKLLVPATVVITIVIIYGIIGEFKKFHQVSVFTAKIIWKSALVLAVISLFTAVIGLFTNHSMVCYGSVFVITGAFPLLQYYADRRCIRDNQTV
jgi:hypothetical protein